MDAFYESPIPVLLAGLIVGSGLAVAYLNTRQRGLLVAIGLVVAAVIGGVVLERSVKTDREKIAGTLDELASALEAEGLPENAPEHVIPAVNRVISESAKRTQGLAATNLSLAKITRASYSNLRVEVDEFSIPPSAEVRFDAKISGEGRPPLNDVVAHRTYPLEFEITMVYETDSRFDEPRWLIGNQLAWRLKTLGQEADPGRFGFDTGEMIGN